MISKKRLSLFVTNIIHDAKVLDLKCNTPSMIRHAIVLLEALDKERLCGVLHGLDRFWLEARVAGDVARDLVRDALTPPLRGSERSVPHRVYLAPRRLARPRTGFEISRRFRGNTWTRSLMVRVSVCAPDAGFSELEVLKYMI